MDLHTITEVLPATSRDDLRALGAGTAVLAGGTVLFSEPHTQLTRLVDITGLRWPSLTVRTADADADPDDNGDTGADDGDRDGPAGLEIAATCTIAELTRAALPADWVARPLVRQCCEAFLASFKIHRFGTVGGNLCLGYPAGSMISLTAALEGSCTVWTPDGEQYVIPVVDFVTGNCTTVLSPGDVLRSIWLPARALRSRTAFRKIALSPLGRSGAVIIGRRDGAGLVVTITASTVRPVHLRFPLMPGHGEVASATGQLPGSIWHDDPHGPPDWRAHVSGVLAEQIRAELADDADDADGADEAVGQEIL